MKKFIAGFAMAALFTACNDTTTTTASEADSATAVATADSLAAVRALSDTAAKPLNDGAPLQVDSTKTKMTDTTVAEIKKNKDSSRK